MGGKLSIDNFSLSQCFANRSCLLLTPARLCSRAPARTVQRCSAAETAVMMGRSGRLRLHRPSLADSRQASLLPCSSAQVGLAKLWLCDLGSLIDPL